MASDSNSDAVQLEIPADKLESLFNRGELCAAEVRCLNSESKESIRKLCLRTCMRKSGCRFVGALLNVD